MRMKGCTPFYLVADYPSLFSFFHLSIYGKILPLVSLFFQNVEKARGNYGFFFPESLGPSIDIYFSRNGLPPYQSSNLKLKPLIFTYLK